MEKTYREAIDMWSLRCDQDHVLHDTRQAEVTEIRQTIVPASDLEHWEELPADTVTPYTKIQYDAKVAALVRQQYSASEEFSLQRKAINAAFAPSGPAPDDKALSEYQAYNAYVEECKQRAKAPELYVANDVTPIISGMSHE